MNALRCVFGCLMYEVVKGSLQKRKSKTLVLGMIYVNIVQESKSNLLRRSLPSDVFAFRLMSTIRLCSISQNPLAQKKAGKHPFANFIYFHTALTWRCFYVAIALPSCIIGPTFQLVRKIFYFRQVFIYFVVVCNSFEQFVTSFHTKLKYLQLGTVAEKLGTF